MPPLRPPPSARLRRQEPQPHEDDLSCASFMAGVVAWLQNARQRCTRQRVRFFFLQHIPILEWLPSYDLSEDLQYDIVSGVTVGMMIVPQEISLSTMMGVPPIYGLYTAALVPMIYPLFGTSRVLSVANGAEVSLLVGSAIKKIESEEERVATGILLSFLTGLMLFLMGVFQLGIIADFFSRPVMGGFVSAGGVLIMLSQFANWFGVHIPSRDLPFLTVLDLFEQFPHINGNSFMLGAVSIAILFGMRALKRSVVIELHKLEEELETEFELETSRAGLTRINSQSDLGEDDFTDISQVDEEGESDDEKENEPKDAKRKTDTNSEVRATPRRRTSLQHMASSLGFGDFLTSPSARRTDISYVDMEARSSRQSDLSAVLRSTRHRNGPSSNVLMDEGGVGFSLSDEDYMTLEKPLEYEYQARRNAAAAAAVEDAQERGLALPPTLARSASVGPRLAKKSEEDSDEQREIEDDSEEPQSGPQVYARVRNMASPAKSVSSDTASLSDSVGSTTALNGRRFDGLSSMTIRILRSKIAVLIALRLVCDLGAFMVCLIGGIIGYVAAEGSLVLTGPVPGGYPSPILPWYGLLDKLIEADRLYHIIIDTLSIGIIAYMSSIAMAKRLAIKEGYRIRPNQELIALGLSNLVGAFFQGMPATGGLSRTAVNMQNARTQLASLITVLVVVLALYTATSALAYLPKASLSAIIIVAGQSLIETKEAKWLYRVKRDEFYVWLASFVLTVTLGVLPGLLSSIFCSLIAVIYKTRRPTVTMLGEIMDEDTGETSIVDLDLYPETARPLSDIIVIRVEGALYFANCEYIERVIEREIERRHETEGVRVLGVIIDACSIMDWDSTTIQMMKHLNQDLHMRRMQLSIVNARGRLHNLLRSSEFLAGIVLNDARIGFDEAIVAIRELAILNDQQESVVDRKGNPERALVTMTDAAAAMAAV